MVDLFPGVRVLSASSRPERAHATSWCLGAGRAVVVQDAAEAVERSARGRDAATDTFKLLLQTHGHARLVHGGHRLVLAPRDIVLMDGARSFRMELEPDYRQAVIELPRGWVSRRCGVLLARVGQGLSAEEPAVQALFETLMALLKQLPSLTPAQRAPLLDVLLALLIALAGPRASITASGESRLARARADIDAHLSDPDLDATRLARLQGISRRHLDAIFAANGQSPERTIWHRRLERVRQELQDPAQAHRPLIDIAFAWGFNSQAHFSRVFRRRFGQSPSVFRAQQAVEQRASRRPQRKH
jgi:AraC-like DNA-binding protein